LIVHHPAPPPQPVSVEAPKANAVVQPTALPSSPANISPPESILLQSFSKSTSPAPAEPQTPAASTSISTPVPSASPPASPSHELPSSQQPEVNPPAATTESAKSAKSAIAERKQVLQERLADIVAKEKPKKDEQLRQSLIGLAICYAEQGSFEQARQFAQDPLLSIAVQADLLAKIDAIQARFSKQATSPVATKSGQNPIASEATGELLPQSNLSPQSLFPTTLFNGQAPNIRLPFNQLIQGNLSLIFPLTIAAPITSPFGWRTHPISGIPRFHQGLDLGAPMGSPVLAAHAGTVESADYQGGYGLAIVLRHKNGTQETLYGHLSGVFVKPGDVIKQGQLIGLVGSTGASTGPHLHFEFRQLTGEGWISLDPAAQLNQAIATLAQGSALPSSFQFQPQQISLAASGTVNLSPLRIDMGGIYLDDSVVTSLMPNVSDQTDLVVPLSALLPAATPLELNWLIYPLMHEVSSEPSSALLGLPPVAPEPLTDARIMPLVPLQESKETGAKG